MTPAHLKEIKERAEASYSWPIFWECLVGKSDETPDFQNRIIEKSVDFYNAARQDVPGLVAEVERLRACLGMIAATMEEDGDATTLAKCQAIAIGALEDTND